ncbi:L-rhamnose-binding lectin CSL3-like [Labeo rohita]|uniref:L-rhamnose-binding lectin CSL3-like n=1 Tax=Labeo rohita TaxID=84645 RepID=UPI0021E28E49|nr:L-rhamnose-binding lectin CSL3-like [Labeo rohita]
MMVQRLSGITFLLLLCQHACANVKPKQAVACQEGNAYLTCDSGFIHILDANYGRTDISTCSEGKPLQQISNVYCYQETSFRTMSVRCNGKRSCTVDAENSVFSDPCSSTFKYLKVSYECRQLQQSITCENFQSVIACDGGIISIHHANYGRRDSATCPHATATSICYFPQTTGMRSRCNGKRSCDLDASNQVFSNPCGNVYKYLEVTYSCARV